MAASDIPTNTDSDPVAYAQNDAPAATNVIIPIAPQNGPMIILVLAASACLSASSAFTLMFSIASLIAASFCCNSASLSCKCLL